MINFSVLDEVADESPKGDYVAIENTNTVFLSGNVSAIAAAVGKGTDVHFSTAGEFSLHELIEALAEKMGRVDSIVLSSFSFTEQPTRMLAAMRDRGLVGKLYILGDVRAKANYPGVYQQLEMITDRFAIVPVHAKVTVLQSKTESITVVGSANWTTNKRLETGIITMNAEAAVFHRQWIIAAINKKNEEGE